LNTADFTLYDLIARNAVVYADREALVGGGGRLSFAAFLNRCKENAAGLRAAGLGAGDRIALLAGNELSFLCLCGAAAGLGAVVVPVNWRLCACPTCATKPSATWCAPARTLCVSSATPAIA